jgi:hypothetical protein
MPPRTALLPSVWWDTSQALVGGCTESRQNNFNNDKKFIDLQSKSMIIK